MVSSLVFSYWTGVISDKEGKLSFFYDFSEFYGYSWIIISSTFLSVSNISYLGSDFYSSNYSMMFNFSTLLISDSELL